MPISWTSEQVTSFAPDAASLKAGRPLAVATLWKTLGRTDAALWGEIKGSGANPYQVGIDLNSPAFKCSCPSRKFPCKHGLGLSFLFAASPTALSTNPSQASVVKRANACIAGAGWPSDNTK